MDKNNALYNCGCLHNFGEPSGCFCVKLNRRRNNADCRGDKYVASIAPRTGPRISLRVSARVLGADTRLHVDAEAQLSARDSVFEFADTELVERDSGFEFADTELVERDSGFEFADTKLVERDSVSEFADTELAGHGSFLPPSKL